MAESKVSEAFDIYIVGLGIVSIRHVTREVEAAFRRSKEVLYLAPNFGVREYLEQVCPKLTDLYGISYREGTHRSEAYDIMAASVINAALEHPPVTFASGGHPKVYVRSTRQILQAAPYLDLRVKVLPGISALDCMLIDLGLDPAVEGLQMYEATDLLIRQRPLQPDVPCLLWQIGSVETSLYTTAASKPERYSRIKHYLLKYYPAEHKVTAIYSADHPLGAPLIHQFPLGEIEEHSKYLHPGLTLYIPPVNQRPDADYELLEQVGSADHLIKVTKPTTR